MNSNANVLDYISTRTDLVENIKNILISSLKLDYKPEQINADEILFGAGFSLDSIDSLQLTVAISSDLGVEIPETDMWALRSVNTLADYVLKDKDLLDLKIRNKPKNYTIEEGSYLGYNKIRNGVLFAENTDYLLLRLNDEKELQKLNAIISKDIDFTPEGSVTQTLFLDDSGTFAATLFFMNNFDHHYLLIFKEDKETVFPLIAAANIQFIDITTKSTFFSLDGYKATETIENCFDLTLSSLRPYSFSLETFEKNNDFLAARLDSYGEFGYLIIAFSEESKDKILECFMSNNISPVAQNKKLTFETKQLLWLEACRFHPAICFFKNETPVEAGLSALISFDKEAFTGKLALDSTPVKNQLVYFQSEQQINKGDTIFSEGKKTGYIIACQFSPVLNTYIGNAYISKELSSSGALFETGDKFSITIITAPQVLGHSYADIL